MVQVFLTNRQILRTGALPRFRVTPRVLLPLVPVLLVGLIL